MFFILPLRNDVNLKNTDLRSFVYNLFRTNYKIDVIDTKDMIIETIDADRLRGIIQRHKSYFPQLSISDNRVVLADNTLEITGGMLNKAVFYDKLKEQKVKITKTRKATFSYNKVFDKYIIESGIALDENYAGYDAQTISIEGNKTRKKLELTIQGISDNFNTPVCSALFINKCFVCYLDNDFSFTPDGISIDIAEFYKDKEGYKLTLMSANNNEFFTVTMNSMLYNIDFIGLSKVKRV